MDQTKNFIESGQAILGIEFGSTRIKAVLLDNDYKIIATGGHEWENRLIDQIWTYSMNDIWTGLAESYQDLAKNVKSRYGCTLTNLKSIGISGMMHGYMVFDSEENLLSPFRTWRNTFTEEASGGLNQLFNYNIPQRFSIAHLYQSILNDHGYIKDIHYMTTLAGFIHWQLTGEKAMGIGEASGMFPIDTKLKNYHQEMLAKFDDLVSRKNYPWRLENILPKVLVAGEQAGSLTAKGARLLDPTGNLQSGIPFCPPEGDAGTGMVATNSISVRTGNVSAGTSIFAMVVLENELSKPYEELDMVTTPSGELVAMVHCNNCTTDLNAWVNLFKEFVEVAGFEMDISHLYKVLYEEALKGDPDGGGLLAYNFDSGEHIPGFEEGRPLFVRKPDSNFNLANFMKTHLYTSLGALKMGMKILQDQEKVKIDKMLGHGGLFKTKGVGQKFMADAINSPVYVMETASEGGAWGIGLLASYMSYKQANETLPEFLTNRVFANNNGNSITPDPEGVKGFETFYARYVKGLAIERAAVNHLN